jgi:hypothetical protein
MKNRLTESESRNTLCGAINSLERGREKIITHLIMSLFTNHFPVHATGK